MKKESEGTDKQMKINRFTVFTTLTPTSSLSAGAPDLGSDTTEILGFLGSNPTVVSIVDVVDKGSDVVVVVDVVVNGVWVVGQVSAVIQQQKGPLSVKFKGPSPVGC
jgi:hypothetical protein